MAMIGHDVKRWSTVSSWAIARYLLRWSFSCSNCMTGLYLLSSIGCSRYLMPDENWCNVVFLELLGHRASLKLLRCSCRGRSVTWLISGGIFSFKGKGSLPFLPWSFVFVTVIAAVSATVSISIRPSRIGTFCHFLIWKIISFYVL